jgi:hypothetical protein
MKKLLVGSVLLSLLASCQKEEIIVVPTPRETKTVVLNLQQSKDHSSATYDGVEAEVRLAIGRTNLQTGATTLVWDSTIQFQSLRNFPQPQSPRQVVKLVSNVDDNKETISASYSIRYRDAQNRIQQVGRNEFAPAGASSLQLNVRL